MKWWWICVLLFNFTAKAQTITTFAGCGISCTGLGEGGPATIAAIPNPVGGAFDKHGNYYFASCVSGHRIRKISPTGTITTVAGTGLSGFLGDGGPATGARLNGPTSVKLDSSGNLYISDCQNFRIRKVDILTGIISTVIGNGSPGFYGEGIPATAAQINGVQDICFDKYGNLYIADVHNYRVRKINTSGIISTFAGSGSFGFSGDGLPATSASFTYPAGIEADSAGNIYVGDANNFRVRKINTIGTISTVAGNGSPTYIGDGIPATAAQFEVGHLAIDSSNNLYIADRKRVLKVDNAGIIHNMAGDGTTGFTGDGGPATAASLDYPSGLSFDPCWNLYITEANNRRIRKVTFNPICDLSTLEASAIEKAQDISIYPNPANDELQIENANPNSEYKLYNLVGIILQHGVLQYSSNTIQLNTLPPGMYLLQIADSKGERTVHRIIKQ